MSSEKRRYRYLSVSLCNAFPSEHAPNYETTIRGRNTNGGLTKKNVSILSSLPAFFLSTLSTPTYPPVGTRQFVWIASKIFHPQRRYLGSPVRRYAMKRDSTVSGLQRECVGRQSQSRHMCIKTCRSMYRASIGGGPLLTMESMDGLKQLY